MAGDVLGIDSFELSNCGSVELVAGVAAAIFVLGIEVFIDGFLLLFWCCGVLGIEVLILVFFPVIDS